MKKESVEKVIAKVLEANGFGIKKVTLGWVGYMDKDAEHPFDGELSIAIDEKKISRDECEAEANVNIRKTGYFTEPSKAMKLADEIQKTAHVAQMINDMNLKFERE